MMLENHMKSKKSANSKENALNYQYIDDKKSKKIRK